MMPTAECVPKTNQSTTRLGVADRIDIQLPALIAWLREY